MSVHEREETALGFEEHGQALDNDSQRWRNQHDHNDRQNQQNQQNQHELYELEKFDDDDDDADDADADDTEERLPYQSSVSTPGIFSQILKGGMFILLALAAGWVGGWSMGQYTR